MDEKQRKTKVIGVRLETGVANELEALAIQFGVSTSALCSMIITTGLGIGKAMEKEGLKDGNIQ